MNGPSRVETVNNLLSCSDSGHVSVSRDVRLPGGVNRDLQKALKYKIKHKMLTSDYLVTSYESPDPHSGCRVGRGVRGRGVLIISGVTFTTERGREEENNL